MFEDVLHTWFVCRRLFTRVKTFADLQYLDDGLEPLHELLCID